MVHGWGWKFFAVNRCNWKNAEKKDRIDPPRGRPGGGGGTYHNRGYGGLNPHNSVRTISIFIRTGMNNEFTPDQ
jgi:hypothetical protein